MALVSEFKGFPKECVNFYVDVVQNNSKAWFDSHKNVFESYVMTPARDFVSEMGKLLGQISPGINADPRLNRSIFRPYRDTRFSKDKTPYKTHLGIFFWEGSREKWIVPDTTFILNLQRCFSLRACIASRRCCWGLIVIRLWTLSTGRRSRKP